METTEGTPVLIRVEGGHIHRAVKVGEALLSFEGCNLDQALLRREVSAEELELAEPGELCEQPTCFPPVGGE